MTDERFTRDEIHDLRPINSINPEAADWLRCAKCGFMTRSEYPPRRCPVKG